MKRIGRDKNIRLSFIVGIVFSSIGIGFSLMKCSQIGVAFFFFIPLVIGIYFGVLPEPLLIFSNLKPEQDLGFYRKI